MYLKEELLAIKRFFIDTTDVVHEHVLSFCKGFIDHIETTGILFLATIGLDALLGELPFIFNLPLWIEAAFVIPVIAVLLILLLLYVSQHRPHFSAA